MQSRLKLVHISFWTYLLLVVYRVQYTVPQTESARHIDRCLSSSMFDDYPRVCITSEGLGLAEMYLVGSSWYMLDSGPIFY
jgi:hypothetical protein